MKMIVTIATLLGLFSVVSAEAQSSSIVAIASEPTSVAQFVPGAAMEIMRLILSPETRSCELTEVDINVWEGSVRNVAVVSGSGDQIFGQEYGYNAVNGIIRIKTQGLFLDRAKDNVVNVLVTTDFLSSGTNTAYVGVTLAGLQTSGNTYVSGDFPSPVVAPVAVNYGVGEVFVEPASSVTDSPIGMSDISASKSEILGGWDFQVYNEGVTFALPTFQIHSDVGRPNAIAALRLVDEEGNVIAKKPSVSSAGLLTFKDSNSICFPNGGKRIFLVGALGGTFAHGGDVTIGLNVSTWTFGVGQSDWFAIIPQSSTPEVTSATKTIWGPKFLPPSPPQQR